MIILASNSPPPPPFASHLAEWVFASFRHHHELMGLSAWTIKLSWIPVPDHKVMASSAEPEYYQASVDVDLADLDEYLSDYVRHELFHVILWQYTQASYSLAFKRARTTLNRLEERTVSDLERMPLWETLSSPPA